MTEHFKPTVDTHHGSQLPGVFIFYDLSPIKVPFLASACFLLEFRVVYQGRPLRALPRGG